MDDHNPAELKDLLEEWEIEEDIINNFIDGRITIDHLITLTDDNLKELCKPLGVRLTIRRKIDELKRNVPDPLYVDDDVENNAGNNIDDNNLVAFDSFPDINLKAILENTSEGEKVLHEYAKNNRLSSRTRQYLTDITVRHLHVWLKNNTMKNHHFAILLRAIKKEFPMEPPGVYYVSPISSKTSPTGKCIPARGKIYQKIRNSRSNTENSRKRKRDDPAYVFQQKEALEKLKDSHREDLDWLNSHSSPWKTVLEKWRKTYDVRKNSTYATVSEFLEEWTIFNNSKSVELIALDFSIMYPDKGTDFHRKWEIFYEKLKIIRADKYASERLKKVLKDLQPIVNSEEFQDSRMLLEFKIVAMLVAPKARASKKIKYSTQESIDSIIRFADSAADIEEVKKTQRGRAKMIKDTVQPYIIIQGNIQNIDQILIVIDEIKYEFQSIIEAFDCLFKLFHVFQVKYPKAGYHLHLLIQRTVYKIETPYDLIPQNITDIVTEFERST